jgi:hypothetical protein
MTFFDVLGSRRVTLNALESDASRAGMAVAAVTSARSAANLTCMMQIVLGVVTLKGRVDNLLD